MKQKIAHQRSVISPLLFSIMINDVFGGMMGELALELRRKAVDGQLLDRFTRAFKLTSY